MITEPPLSSIPVALAINPDITPRSIHLLYPTDINPPAFLIPPPPLSKTVDRKRKIFKLRKSFDATLLDKPTSSVLKDKIDEPSTSIKLLDLKTAFDFSSEHFLCYILNFCLVFTPPLLLMVF